MHQFINMRLNNVARFTFDNGWTISITKTITGDQNIIIMPAIDTDKSNEFYASHSYYSDENLRKSGNYIENYSGTDDELLTIIGEVALRDNHSSLHTAGKLLDEFLTKRKT